MINFKFFCLFIFATTIYTIIPNYASSQATTSIESDSSFQENLGSYLDFVEILSKSGFSIISIEKTFLNRFRIISNKNEMRRETIISVSTNLILRDSIWTE